MQYGKLTCVLLALAGVAVAAQARAKVTEDQNGSLKNLTSIGDALNAPDHHPVHILYVHGVNEIGAGDSALLRESICTRLKLCEPADWQNAGTEFADRGEFAPGSNPPPLDYLEKPIWRSQEEWRASAPFVDHWVIHLKNHASLLVVDELNWWPLVLSVKCRDIVAAEAHVAGPNASLLEVCSQRAKQDPGGLGHFYPWISPDEAAALAKVHSKGALANRAVKESLIDWGLSDVLIVTGQLRDILRDGLRQLMAKSAAFDPTAAAESSPASNRRGRYDWRAQFRRGNVLDQEFVGVTHSLGAYLLFDALSPIPAGASAAPDAEADGARRSDEDSALKYIFERTSLCYFLANQIQMLEVTNLDTGSGDRSGTGAQTNPAPDAGKAAAPAAPAPNFVELVNRWQQLHDKFQAAVHSSDESAREKLQVVAWTDPSDMLSWRVPRIGNVDVVNLYVQNAPHWLGLFESPTGAHVGYAQNKQVLRAMFKDTERSRR
jgi:hypothetical protein